MMNSSNLNYKHLVCIWLLIVACAKCLAAGVTNSTYSQLTISNMFYTNRVALDTATSNVNYLTTNNFTVLSNLSWQLSFAITNGNISTNIAVIVPGSLTNRINVTNGSVRSVTVLP